MTNGQDILAMGYGIIPKMVMKDTELTIEAKAIFAYIASYAGAGDSAFPSVSLICHDLSISPDRFRKHRKGLLEKGYIVIQSTAAADGKFSNNLYVINHTITQPHNEPEATELEQPLPDFTATETLATESQSTENLVTNNNSDKSNSFNKSKEDDDDDINKQTTKKTDENFNHWQRDWHNHFGSHQPYTQMIHRGLQNWVSYFGDEEIVQHAFLLAGKYGARSYAYLESVLKNWRDEGITTLEEIYDRELEVR